MTEALPVRKLPEEPAERIADGDRVEPPGANAEASERFGEAIIAARSLLVATVDAVDPETSAEELLKIVKDYRARLAALVAVLPVPDGGDGV